LNPDPVQVSSLPGVRHPVFIAGSRITRMYPFGPLPGCAAVITPLSHEDFDPAAIIEPAMLVDALVIGRDEVAALAERA
jgi:hypothetical protein